MPHSACYRFPFGLLEISCNQNAVTSLRIVPTQSSDQNPSDLTDLAAAQIQEYWEGKRKRFDFPVSPEGTLFRKAVWNALLEIPYGQTRAYGQIAAAIGKPGAARAVGQACNRNPVWIVIPCHRVIGKNGSLTGYEGGLDIKKALLALEQTYK